MLTQRTEDVVAQDDQGQWGQRTVNVAHRFRLRVVSDLSSGKSHKFGHGEEFELLIDRRMGFWVRLFGAQGPFRRDEDGYGVALVLDDDGSTGGRDGWIEADAETYDHGSTRHHRVRVAKRVGLRVVTDRTRAPAGHTCHTVNFQLAVDTHLCLWISASGGVPSVAQVLSGSADAAGVYTEIVENITDGVEHEVTVQVKPADPDVSRWSCTCGAASRAPLEADVARAEADLHLVDVREREERERAVRALPARPQARSTSPTSPTSPTGATPSTQVDSLADGDAGVPR